MTGKEIIAVLDAVIADHPPLRSRYDEGHMDALVSLRNRIALMMEGSQEPDPASTSFTGGVASEPQPSRANGSLPRADAPPGEAPSSSPVPKENP